MTQEPVPVSRTVDFGVARLLPDLDRPRAWLLTVDGAPQSYVDLDEPEHLEFEYTRRIAHVLESAFDTPMDVVHLGGGALTLPRRLASTRPGSRQRVVEADRALAALVAELLPLRDPGVTVDTADAREWLTAAADGGADAIVVDVFGGSRVPAHLTSVEFLREAVRVLRPRGVYVANIADAAPFTFLGSQLGTVRAAFGPDAELCLLAEPGVLRGRRFGNAVLVAARRPLPLDTLARLCAADAFPARVVTGRALRDLTGTAVRDASATPSPEPPDGAFTVG
ncbi:spermidine synthase [Streptomyces polygonati]|uniref:Spermidine synthase n=1 Tax=Streptomyces polygonati TaxID=1617087 RepID=A0ABV8HJS9_9ACTN